MEVGELLLNRTKSIYPASRLIQLSYWHLRVGSLLVLKLKTPIQLLEWELAEINQQQQE